MSEGQRSTNPLNTDSSVVAFIPPQPPFPLLAPFLPHSPDFSSLFPSVALLLCLSPKSARVRREGERDKSRGRSKKNDGARENSGVKREAEEKLEVVAVSDMGQVWRTITPLWAASFGSCQPAPHACDKGRGGGGDRNSRVLSPLREKKGRMKLTGKTVLKRFG